MCSQFGRRGSLHLFLSHLETVAEDDRECIRKGENKYICNKHTLVGPPNGFVGGGRDALTGLVGGASPNGFVDMVFLSCYDLKSK